MTTAAEALVANLAAPPTSPVAATAGRSSTGAVHVVPSVVRMAAGAFEPFTPEPTRWMPAQTALVALTASSETGHQPAETAAACHVRPPSVVRRIAPVGAPWNVPAAIPPAIQPFVLSTNLTDV